MILWAFLGCMQLDGLVHPGDPRTSYDLTSAVIPAERIEVVSIPTVDDHYVSGVWLRQDPPAPPMIWWHGNGGAIDTYVDRLETYWQWGRWDVFVPDYRGFGMSSGEPSFQALFVEDGPAIVDWVSAESGVPPEQIPWISLSLGSAIATHTNVVRDAQVLELENMYASTDWLLDRGAGLDLPTGWFFEAEYDNLGPLAQAQAPVFIVHGLADDFIEPASAVAEFEVAPDPKELWQPEGVNHADIHRVIPDTYRERVIGFIDRHPAEVP